MDGTDVAQGCADAPMASGCLVSRAGDMGRYAAWAWFFALVGWTAFVAFFDLAGGPQLGGAECWVAQTSREMYEAGDWITPVFSGELRLQKSPGAYWITMLVGDLRGRGVDVFAVRTQSALATILLVVVVFELTRRIAGVRAGLFAGFAMASSVFVFDWSHSAASDFALTAFCTLSVASLWIAFEAESDRRWSVAFLLLGYLAAGLGMLHKMPMPLACVGGPALVYLLFGNRWRVLANKWHLLGLLLFALPWVPWIVAMVQQHPIAWDKWRVEFFDRFTGRLPNLNEESGKGNYFFYLAPPLVYTLPYTLSLPGAIFRACRRRVDEGVHPGGLRFVLGWFLVLFVIFTAAAGKETRYFLPALPPLFVLLGCELSAFYGMAERLAPGRLRFVRVAAAVVVPAAFVAVGFVLSGSRSLSRVVAWSDVMPGYVVASAVFSIGAVASIWLYAGRRGTAAFGALVVAMWGTWICCHTMLLPQVGSQARDRDFAMQLRDRLTAGQQACLYQVGYQNPTIIWHSDVRFPRIIDQLELLRRQGGVRDRQRELALVGREMIDKLAGEELALLVIRRRDFLEFVSQGKLLLAEGEVMPETHLWIQPHTGSIKGQMLVVGNQPPPWPEETLSAKAR